MDEEAWTELYKAFDPMEAAPAKLRVERAPYNPLADEVVPRLRLKLGYQRIGLAGVQGSGKSTELRKAGADLADGKLVVLIDLWRHFQSTVSDPAALDRLHPAELVGLIGLAVVRAGKDGFAHHFEKADVDALSQAISRIAGSTDEDQAPKLDVGKLVGGVSVLTFGVVGAVLAGPAGAAAGAGAGVAAVQVAERALPALADAFTWDWKIGLPGRTQRSDQDGAVQAVVKATNTLLDALRVAYARPAVVVLDGLDRINNETTFRSLFVESSLLGELRCDVIAALQLGLTQKHTADLRFDVVLSITNVPVVLHDDPDQPDPRGLRFFAELVSRRLAALALSRGPLDDAAVNRLAIASGGRLRDFMSLVRGVCVECMTRALLAADEESVRRTIDAFRRSREAGLTKVDFDQLAAVLADPQGELLPEALPLLETSHLLAYPNESTWYLPHPILIPYLKKRAGSTTFARSSG
jgi:hypothetical protein